MVTTNASLTGWGGTLEGRSVNGRWGTPHSIHINCLELMAVEMVLRHFLPFLVGRHVLVRTDNTKVVEYINKQGGDSPKVDGEALVGGHSSTPVRPASSAAPPHRPTVADSGGNIPPSSRDWLYGFGP